MVSDEAITDVHFDINALSAFVVALNVANEKPDSHSDKDAVDSKNVHIVTECSQTSFDIAWARKSGTLAVIEPSTGRALAAFWIILKVDDQSVGISRHGKLVVIPSCFCVAS